MELTDTTIIDDACKEYFEGTPTFAVLRKYHPEEFLPLVIIGGIILVANFAVSMWTWRTQFQFFSGCTLVPAFRTFMILFSFLLFPAVSFVGMLSLRSSQFLHSIVNVFESCCILAFYENMCGHLRLGDFMDGTKKVSLRVGPCCCCFVCLKPASATEKTVSRLRIAMIVMIILQMLLQFARTVRNFECAYNDGSTPAGIFMNMLMLIAFLCSMYGLMAIFRSGGETLAKYSYTAKFVAFKLMVFISKFLYTILSYIAMTSEDAIPSYYAEIEGVKVLIVKGKARITIWTNFISIVLGTLLLALTFRFYREEDYKPYIQEVSKSTYKKTGEEVVTNTNDINEEEI